MAKKIPKNLIEVLAAREAVGIVGAGVSVAAGFPGWKSLLELLIKECESHIANFPDAVELRRLLKDGRYTVVADACVKALRGPRYREFMQRIFRPDRVTPTKLHQHIIRLPFASILTTNYDTLLEQAFVGTNKALKVAPVYTQKNVSQLAQLTSDRSFFIFKAHGHIDDIDTIVLTQKDYQDLLHQNAAYRTALSALFATRSMVFMGYGLQDPDLNLLLSQQVSLFRGYGRRHFAFVPNPGRAESESFAEHYNIEVIPYSPDNGHKELTDLVALLGKKTGQQVVTLRAEQEARNASIKRLSRREKIREVMEFERRICGHLQGYIELERARFLKLHEKEAGLSKDDRKLIEQSVAHWEKQKNELASLESQLRQTQKMESLGILASGIAHDFNNILVGIEGYRTIVSELIPKDSPAQKYLDLSQKVNARAKDLIQQILLFARGESEQKRELVDISIIVGESVQLLKGNSIAKNIAVEWEAPDRPFVVRAGRSQMSQLVMNILINAIQAIDEGPGKIQISLNAIPAKSEELTALGLRNADFLRLTITDNGPGIPPENLKRIFEPFFTTKSPDKGTGLGLSVVHGIVTGHEGAVSVESHVGSGAAFSVYLPIENQRASAPSAGDHVLHDGRGRKILLVDDESTVLEVTSHYLQQLGFEVDAFTVPADALVAFQKNNLKYDLVITDQIMPNMKGLDFCAMVHALRKEIPTLLMSGYKFDAVQARRAGITALIPKPFTKEEFADAVFRAAHHYA